MDPKAPINFILDPLGYRLIKKKKYKPETAAAENSKSGINQFFGTDAKIKNYLSAERMAFYREVIEFFEKKGVLYNGKKIADAGCGTGHLLKNLENNYRADSLHGFDYGDATLQSARQLLPAVPLETLDLHVGCDKKFDIVFCTEVLEHLLYPDKGLKNLAQMVLPGGYLLLTVPNGRLDSYDGHINFWSPTSWHIFLEQNLEGCDINTGVLNEKTGILLYALIRKQ